MAELRFTISELDEQRLLAIQQVHGHIGLKGEGMSDSEFAKELLEAMLYYQFPDTPKFDENGKLLNMESYRYFK